MIAYDIRWHNKQLTNGTPLLHTLPSASFRVQRVQPRFDALHTLPYADTVSRSY